MAFLFSLLLGVYFYPTNRESLICEQLKRKEKAGFRGSRFQHPLSWCVLRPSNPDPFVSKLRSQTTLAQLPSLLWKAWFATWTFKLVSFPSPSFLSL